MVCWFKEIKAHTGKPARWILINLPYINCMLSGITELNAKYKGSFCLGEWNKRLLRILIGSYTRMMLHLRVPWTHSVMPTPWIAIQRVSLIMYNTVKLESPGTPDDQAKECHALSQSHLAKWIPLQRVISVRYNKMLIHNVAQAEMQTIRWVLCKDLHGNYNFFHQSLMSSSICKVPREQFHKSAI